MIPGISEKVDLDYKIGNWTFAGYRPAKKTIVSKPKATNDKELKEEWKENDQDHI